MSMFISMEKYRDLKFAKVNAPLIAQSMNWTTEQHHPRQPLCISSEHKAELEYWYLITMFHSPWYLSSLIRSNLHVQHSWAVLFELDDRVKIFISKNTNYKTVSVLH